MEEKRLVIIKANCHMPLERLEQFYRDFLKQKEKGLILLPSDFECVLNTDDDCEIEFEPDLSPVPDFATKYMNIKDEKCCGECIYFIEESQFGNYLGTCRSNVYTGHGIVSSNNKINCSCFKQKIEKENENG